MPPENPIADVAHVIQLSVAPVFLLTAIGTILAVLSTRLGRIVDRFRVLADRAEGVSGTRLERMETERALLRRRRQLINMAITSGTCAALLVSSVIASAFLGFIFGWKTSGAIATLFILAMVAIMAALVLFLREVLLAVAAVDVEHH